MAEGQPPPHQRHTHLKQLQRRLRPAMQHTAPHQPVVRFWRGSGRWPPRLLHPLQRYTPASTKGNHNGKSHAVHRLGTLHHRPHPEADSVPRPEKSTNHLPAAQTRRLQLSGGHPPATTRRRTRRTLGFERDDPDRNRLAPPITQAHPHARVAASRSDPTSATSTRSLDHTQLRDRRRPSTRAQGMPYPHSPVPHTPVLNWKTTAGKRHPRTQGSISSCVRAYLQPPANPMQASPGRLEALHPGLRSPRVIGSPRCKRCAQLFPERGPALAFPAPAPSHAYPQLTQSSAAVSYRPVIALPVSCVPGRGRQATVTNGITRDLGLAPGRGCE